VTFYPQEGADADLLLRQADQAMYAAKQAGKNRFFLFDVVQDSAVRERRESIERISQALTSNEFVLYYQPKVNMRTEQVVGVEALIRWQHPIRGLLAPAEFLPVIDDHPVSVLIGEWVIKTALTQMATWIEVGFNIPVSVNVGARQLQQDGFVLKLKQILATRGEVDPKDLQLEVLESNALHDINEVGAIMNACKEFGVSFALDDFGTGYSSLTYLKHLPAHTLKIDQSFVRDMLGDTSDLAIVNGVIGLARAFGREVIAEGVETMTHRDMLLSIGCDVAQGYGVARPMPANKLTDWIVNWQIRPHWVE
jgi:EAL domain-containing protein (putative c-di-GMP-specific phosphodiesterase class I)